MGLLDILVVVIYLVAIVGLGCWAGVRGQTKSTDADQAKDYFLAGRTLKWPVIGLALFATNISTVHLVGLAEAGYKSGLLMGNFELLAVRHAGDPGDILCSFLYSVPCCNTA